MSSHPARSPKTHLRLALAAAALIASSAAIATPAQAAPNRCPAQSLCLWNGPNYTGDISVHSGFVAYSHVTAAVHDNARSALSTTKNTRMCIIDWRNGTKVVTGSLRPGQKIPNLLGGVGLAGPDAAGKCAANSDGTAPTLQLANTILAMDYQAFLTYKRTRHPAPFDWSDDGCTSTPPSWANLFNGPCALHDFGYRNFGRGLSLGRDDATRKRIDDRFLIEMRRVCGNFNQWWQGVNRDACINESNVMYTAVRGWGRAAYYGG